jgi:hypothetical protein
VWSCAVERTDCRIIGKQRIEGVRSVRSVKSLKTVKSVEGAALGADLLLKSANGESGAEPDAAGRLRAIACLIMIRTTQRLC